MSFLSAEHIQQLKTICIGFLKEKHNIQLPSNYIDKVFDETVASLTKEVDATTNPSAWNKRVILTVRDHALMAIRTPVRTPALPNVNPTPNPIYDVPAGTKGEDTEEDFFKKLQSLELARKAPVVAAPAPPAIPPPALSSALTPAPTPAPPAQPITVIVPSVAVATSGIITRIHSHDRPWIYQEDIQVRIWNGPLPKQMDESNFRVVHLMVPMQCLQDTPYIILRIEGAGGQHQDVYMTPKTDTHGPWVSYVPCTESVSYVKRFALPWTIRIMDAYEKELNLGKDAWLVEGLEERRLTLTHNAIEDIGEMMSIGDHIRIQDSLGNQHKAVIRKITSPTTVEVRWLSGKRPEVSSLQAPIYCMNEHRQWTMFMESHETTHTTTTKK